MPEIAVVICTRNRGGQAAEAASAVLEDPSPFELVVVDQSTNEATAEALAALPTDSRMRVIRSPLRGLSVARNTGVAACSAPVIAFTDDDCRPGPNWVSTMLRLFEEDPKAALVFGRVHLPAGQDGLGYAASFEPGPRVLEDGIPLPDVALGIGANFAIRRTAYEQLGGFDPLLGAGAPHFSGGGEESDVLIRALHARMRVLNAVESDVLHLGVRTGADIRPLAIGYQLGTGAAFGKLARLTGASGVREFARRAVYYASAVANDAIHLRRPRPGVFCYFVAGAALTYRYGVDHRRAVFRTRNPAATGT
jgi:glycosyltransferase involved in cell wall biosynthesis